MTIGRGTSPQGPLLQPPDGDRQHQVERGAWQGLWYDILGINRSRDQSSERAHPDVTCITG